MKKRTAIFAALLAGFLVTSSPASSATQVFLKQASLKQASSKQGALEYCQKVSDKIRYYTDLRKSGGSAKAMEGWKRQRKKYKKQFTERNCKKW